MADPVADKSGFLKMYMSNHPDTLVAYAKWYGKVAEVIKSAEMTAIDSKSMTLTCTLKNGSSKVVRVPLEPPLSGYDDVKPRLLEMKALAQEGLGMIKAPKVTTIHIPLQALGTLAAILVLVVSCLTPLSTTAAYFPMAVPVHYVAGHAALLYFIAATHVLESIYTFSLCWRHKTPFLVGSAYVLGTLLCGFPVWIALRKHIQAMRIDSVMKIQ